MQEENLDYFLFLASYLKCTQVCYSNYEVGKRDITNEDSHTLI